jgi:hypothetical protein
MVNHGLQGEAVIGVDPEGDLIRLGKLQETGFGELCQRLLKLPQESRFLFEPGVVDHSPVVHISQDSRQRRRRIEFPWRGGCGGRQDGAC